MKNKRLIILITLLWAAIAVQAQEILTLEGAIISSLENNHDIRLSRYDVEESKNNVSRAISGQMPRLEHNVGFEFGYSDAEIQTLGLGGNSSESGGAEAGGNPPLELDGVNRQIIFQPQLTIPIFSGFSGRYRFKQLENAHQMKNIELEAVMEQAVMNTVQAYLEVARLQTKLNLISQNMEISMDRYQRAKGRAEFGTSNSVRKLQALVALKTDSTEYRNIALAYENAKRELNLVMAEKTGKSYRVQEKVVLREELTLTDLQTSMSQHNAHLKLSKKGIEQTDLNSKISESAFMPSVSAFADYTYLDSEDDASFLQGNRVLGPGIGINMRWSIFTGGANKIQKQNAKIKQFKQEAILEQMEYFLEKQLQNAYAQYQNSKEQLRIAQSNLATFEINFKKVEQDFQLGLIDASDLRTAQLSLASAKNQINDLMYAIKKSETQLLQLSGKLINQE